MAAINIKGTRQGLIICVQSPSFEDAKNELIEKLESARDFFKEANFNIHSSEYLEADKKKALEHICIDMGLTLDETIFLPEIEEKKESPAGSGTETIEDDVIIRGTVRSGQRISAKRDVVVVGNVNPGAELIAGRNIIVMGSLRGTVHAGAGGDTGATITAQEMLPSQIRIAGMVACKPEHDQYSSGHTEIAYISGSEIVIDRCESKNKWGKKLVSA